jgi:hypothetical protein
LPGVSGVGVEKEGKWFTVVVYLEDAGARQRLPVDLEGHPYKTVVTGAIRKQ